MKSPLISIVIPVYNDEQYLATALNSCINQTFRDIEIVVVDDASTDKTPNIIAEYAKNDLRIKSIRHDQNKKTLQAIKTGVLAARGDYIMNMSGDDTFDLNAVEICAKVIRDNPGIDIVHFGRRIVSTDSDEVGIVAPDAVRLRGSEILKNLYGATKGARSNHQCRKRTLSTKIFKQLAPEKQLVLGEDQVFAFLYALRAKSYVAIPDVLYTYNFGVGMDGKNSINLEYFLEYRMTMADSIDELQKQLKSMKVAKWVWSYFTALKREHYAWSALVTRQLNSKDRFTALKQWTDRTNAIDTLIGVATTTPYFLDEYMSFLTEYQKEGFDMVDCQEIVGSLRDHYSCLIDKKGVEVSSLAAENTQQKTELTSFLSIKRSARLLADNIKRRIKYGGKRQ